jgi:hypothetical protein
MMQIIIDVDKSHVMHAHFHPELKSDMDLERLHSGKFETNFLMCTFSAVVKSSLRHAAKKICMKMVIQKQMFTGGRMIKNSKRCVFWFWHQSQCQLSKFKTDVGDEFVEKFFIKKSNIWCSPSCSKLY